MLAYFGSDCFVYTTCYKTPKQNHSGLEVIQKVIIQWNLDLTKGQGTGKLVRYIEGSLNRKPRYNEFAEKQPKCSLYRGIPSISGSERTTFEISTEVNRTNKR